MCKLFPSHDENLYLMGAAICHSRCQANFKRWLIMLLHWYACISINNYHYKIYHISSEMVWWALSNTTLIMWIYSAIYEISANKTFTVTDGLISQLFVVAFVHPIYVWIALIWSFPVQLSLWKSLHWLWRYKLNEVCDTFAVTLIVKYISFSTGPSKTLEHSSSLYSKQGIYFLFLWNRSFSKIYGMISWLPPWYSLWILLLKHLQILVKLSRNHFLYYLNLY